jgi:hypothetical protein
MQRALVLPALLALEQLAAATSEGSTGSATAASCSTVDKVILGFGNNLGPQ